MTCLTEPISTMHVYDLPGTPRLLEEKEAFIIIFN